MGGYMPENNVIVQVVKDSWDWSKWLLGIGATVISGMIIERFRRKK